MLQQKKEVETYRERKRQTYEKTERGREGQREREGTERGESGERE